MVKPQVRYFQTCDFCHKEYETDEKGMFNIKLPGIHIGERGEKSRTIVSGAICSECMDRLMDSLKEFIDLKEGEYIGNVFSWSKKRRTWLNGLASTTVSQKRPMMYSSRSRIRTAALSATIAPQDTLSSTMAHTGVKANTDISNGTDTLTGTVGVLLTR